MAGIRPEYWIDCCKCGNESVMVENVPSTGRQPKTKQEAWEAAKSVGYKGTITNPICPNCARSK